MNTAYNHYFGRIASIALLVVITGLVYATWASTANAQTNVPIPAPSAASTQTIDKEYEFLKEQTKSFQDFVQTEREQQQKYLEWSIGLAIKILLFFAAILGAVGLKSFLDAKKKVEQLVESQVNEYIRKNLNNVEVTVNHIAEQAYREQFNLQKKLNFLVPSHLLQKANSQVISKLKDRGFNNITVKDISEDPEQDADLIVLFYEEAWVERFTQVSETLKSQSKPMIVSLPTGHQMVPLYEWQIFAHSPITLINWIFVTISSLK